MTLQDIKMLEIPVMDKLKVLGLVLNVIEPRDLDHQFIIEYLQKGVIKKNLTTGNFELGNADKELLIDLDTVKDLRKYYQSGCVKPAWTGNDLIIQERFNMFFKNYGMHDIELIKRCIDNYLSNTSAKYIKKFENFIITIDPLTNKYTSTLADFINDHE